MILLALQVRGCQQPFSGASRPPMLSRPRIGSPLIRTGEKVHQILRQGPQALLSTPWGGSARLLKGCTAACSQRRRKACPIACVGTTMRGPLDATSSGGLAGQPEVVRPLVRVRASQAHSSLEGGLEDFRELRPMRFRSRAIASARAALSTPVGSFVAMSEVHHLEPSTAFWRPLVSITSQLFKPLRCKSESGCHQGGLVLKLAFSRVVQ